VDNRAFSFLNADQRTKLRWGHPLAGLTADQ
jgi:hypothetical protein